MRIVGLGCLAVLVGCGSQADPVVLAAPPEHEAEPARTAERDPEPAPAPTPAPAPAPAPEVVPESEAETGDSEHAADTVPEPAAEAAAVLGEDGVPVVDPALRALSALPEGPWVFDASQAAMAGVLADAEGEELASVAHHRDTFFLVSAPGGRPEYDGRRRSDQRTALWLVRVVQGTQDGEPTFRREAGVRLYELFFPSAESDVECSAASEVRARDLDGDGEVELTVVAAGAAVPESSMCGSVAFLVGADLNVQARFSREHHYEAYPAGSEIVLTDDTTWIVRDANADGHADLHVVQRFSYRNDFMGDEIEGDVFEPSHERSSDRREVDCLWDAATDTWPCPAVEGYVLGSRLFFDPNDIADPRAARIRFELPPWGRPGD